MNFFRSLTADVPGELLAAQIAARPASTAPTEASPDGYGPRPGDAYLFAVLGVLEAHPGVLTADTPGLPAPVHD